MMVLVVCTAIVHESSDAASLRTLYQDRNFDVECFVTYLPGHRMDRRRVPDRRIAQQYTRLMFRYLIVRSLSTKSGGFLHRGQDL